MLYKKFLFLDQYRKKNNLSAKERVNLLNFTAIDSIFESEKVIDFSLANFIGEKLIFQILILD